MKIKLTILIVFVFSLITNAQKWTSYNTANTSKQLCNNNVNAIAFDLDGSQWFGTTDGVSKFDGTNWYTYTSNNGLINDSVNAIAIDARDNKWFGTWGGGVSKFDGVNWTTYNITNGLASNFIYSISFDSNG